MTDVYGVFLGFMAGVLGLRDRTRPGRSRASICPRPREGIRAHAGLYPGGGFVVTEAPAGSSRPPTGRSPGCPPPSSACPASRRSIRRDRHGVLRQDRARLRRPATRAAARRRREAAQGPRRGARRARELAGEPVHLHVVGPHEAAPRPTGRPSTAGPTARGCASCTAAATSSSEPRATRGDGFPTPDARGRGRQPPACCSSPPTRKPTIATSGPASTTSSCRPRPARSPTPCAPCSPTRARRPRWPSRARVACASGSTCGPAPRRASSSWASTRGARRSRAAAPAPTPSPPTSVRSRRRSRSSRSEHRSLAEQVQAAHRDLMTVGQLALDDEAGARQALRAARTGARLRGPVHGPRPARDRVHPHVHEPQGPARALDPVGPRPGPPEHRGRGGRRCRAARDRRGHRAAERPARALREPGRTGSLPRRSAPALAGRRHRPAQPRVRARTRRMDRGQQRRRRVAAQPRQHVARGGRSSRGTRWSTAA